ncbi:hypothetical protein EUGRSUZ_A00089 [Eucalyptus grandis]|uniref:Uncharacterized protein n=2 Tax=Eucalyptus grandis TaxID=71139 RepID=A0ACC3LZN4_EUCGR|nr:hypothetical protein EUGRSUZ_A00089 [Eucalyptus grandis]
MDPWKKLPPILSDVNAMQSPKLFGISPTNKLFEISNAVKALKLPTSVGRIPVRWLQDKFRMITNDERPISWGGMAPLRLL